MSRISTLASDSLRKVLGNRCHTKATLAINAGGAATIKTTGATIYSIGGVLYTKAALSAQSLAVTHRLDGTPVTTAEPAYVQPAGTTVIYVVALNAAGTVAVVQGSYKGQAVTFKPDLTKIWTGNGDIPEEPSGYTAIGAVKVTTAPATTFTPGTTVLDAAGITATYFDVSVLPETL